jgi:hypothetical protein
MSCLENEDSQLSQGLCRQDQTQRPEQQRNQILAQAFGISACLCSTDGKRGRAYQWREKVGESRRSATGLEYINRVLEEIFVSGVGHDLWGLSANPQAVIQLLGSNHAKSGCRRGLEGDQGTYLGQGVTQQADQ